MDKIAIGSCLDGRYEIRHHVGRGRLGEVFRAVDAETGEDCIVKLLQPELAHDQVAVERFHQDLRQAALIRHANVATLLDYSLLPDGSLYVAWELVDGEPLSLLLDRGHHFQLEHALRLSLQICDGVAAIHREGVAHRDLMPENILLQDELRSLKVVDLGLARSLRGEAEGSTQSVDGMLHYCSPEHLGLVPGVTPDALSDQFALGVVCYQLISGRLPFKGVSTAGSLEARFTKRPRPLMAAEIGAEVTPDLAQSLARAMSFEREERFESVPQLAERIHEALEDLRSKVVERAPEVEIAAPPLADPPPAPPPPPQAEPAPEPAPVEHVGPLPDEAEVVAAIEATIARSEFANALARIEEIRQTGLKSRELGALELRARMALRQQRRTQALEARQMLEAYLAQRQDKLASLALEALLEVDPDVEGREDLERRVRVLVEQVEKEREIDELLNAGYARLRGGDVDGAVAALLEVESRDPAVAARLRQSIERHQIEVSQEERVEMLKRRTEELLSKRRLGEVEEVLESLAALGVPKLVIDVYRHRIESLREERAVGATADEIEVRFRKELMQGQWAEARQLANDLEKLSGDRTRAREMRETVALEEAGWRRRESVREGIERLRGYLALGQVQEAEVALAIVRKLEPQNPSFAEFERQIQILRSTYG